MTLHFGSVAGSWVASLLFAAFGMLAGWAAASLLGRAAAPPNTLSFIGTTPRARRLIGTIVALACMVATWRWLWAGFYTLDVGAESLIARYRVPSRERTLATADVASVRWAPGPKASQWLVLRRRNGEELRSAQTSIGREEATRVLDELRARLQSTRTSTRISTASPIAANSGLNRRQPEGTPRR